MVDIRKIDPSNVRLLWYADFWDGPINGLCVCDNKKCWFEVLDEASEDLPDTTQRRFFVVELAPQQVEEEERMHELFRQKVGTHCDFGEERPEVKPKETHREFYDEYRKRPKPDYSKNAILGSFEMT